MTRRRMAYVSAILVILMAVGGIAVGSQLPAGTQLPVHWNLHGEADRFAGKWVALLAPAGVTAILATIFCFLPAMEPRKAGFAQSQPLYLWGWAATLVLGVALQLIAILTGLGLAAPVPQICAGALGLMWMMMGNQFGKSRSMYMIGIRTPWTLASEEVWIKTHRLAGKLFVIGGGATLLAALARVQNLLLLGILAASLLIGVLVPTIYSFVLWRRETKI